MSFFPDVKSRVRYASLAVLFSIASCSGGGGKDSTPTAPTPVLTTVTVTLGATSIHVGQTAQASASGLDQNNASIATGAVTWSSTTPTVATISASGAITAVAVGQTQIVAVAGGKTGQATLTVIPATAPTITAISPASPTARYTRQTVTITGTNFDPALSLIFTTPSGVATTFTSGPPLPGVQSMQFKSSTSLEALLAIDAFGTYTFQVVNPNGERSNIASAPAQGILGGVVFEGARINDVQAGYPGKPFADVAAIQRADGTWRLLFDAGGAIHSATSPDGLAFTMESGEPIPSHLNNGAGVRPALVKILRLQSGQVRVYFTSGDMYSAISNDDGRTFTMEDGVRMAASAVGAATLTGGSVIRTGSQWRMYFSDAERVYSASSSDLLNWTLDPGVRIGPGSTLGSVEAMHPCAIVNADSSVSVFMFHGPSAFNPAPEVNGIYVATAHDGLTFTTETFTGILTGGDPNVVAVNGGLRMYYNIGDDSGGTIYSARLPLLSASQVQQVAPPAPFGPLSPGAAAPGPFAGRPGPGILPASGRSGKGGIIK